MLTDSTYIDTSEVVKVTETESRMAVTRTGSSKERGNTGRYKILYLQNEKFLKICFTTVEVYLTLLNYTLRNG